MIPSCCTQSVVNLLSFPVENQRTLMQDHNHKAIILGCDYCTVLLSLDVYIQTCLTLCWQCICL